MNVRSTLWMAGATTFLVFLSVLKADARVVVLFSVPHTANVRTHTNVGRALTAIGHDAYVCIPQFMIDQNLANLEGIKVIAYGDYLGNFEDTLAGSNIRAFWKGETPGLTTMIDFVKALHGAVRQILGDKILISKLKEIKPDIILITNFPPFRNFVLLPYILNVPFAYLSPFNDLQGYRVPFSPAATACPLVAGFNQNGLTFLDRLKNTACHVTVSLMEYFVEDDKMVTEFAPHRPLISINELSRQALIYLVESDNILDFAKPQLPNVKLISCTASTPGRPLKDPFKSFIESSKQGIVVVTFGSTVLDIPDKVAQKMVSAFKQQDLNIIWRVNLLTPDPSKMLTSTWIPQNDLLAHSNTKLFVSHCGANGQYETLYHGVPILCLPLFGDQFYNAARSTSKGFGRHANILDITATELVDMMKDIVGNLTYRDNIKKASALYRKLYKVPEQEAAFWLDHVMEHGGAYMRSAGQDMPLYQFLVLDVLALLFILVIGLVLVLYGMYRCCCRVYRRFGSGEHAVTKIRGERKKAE